jgi:predicted DNA-binding transcriptional regulator AlpA
MTEYSFLLKYRLSENDRDADALIERLGEAGCTDALVGIGVAGRLALDFTRDADSAREAIRSALAEIKAVIPSATLVEAAPDLVGLTDVADLMGVARQSMRKLMVGHDDFPLPVHEGTVSLWHLADVLDWLDGRKGYAPERTLRDMAAAAREVNVARETHRYATRTTEELEPLVA